MDRRVLIGVAAALGLAFGCGHHPPAPGNGGGSGVVGNTGGGGGGAERVVITDTAGANGHLGEIVEVKGTAGNAMLGRVIALDDGGPIYCMGKDAASEWPDDVISQPVIATGTLERTDEYTAKDATMQGTNGPVLVLRDCDYRKP